MRRDRRKLRAFRTATLVAAILIATLYLISLKGLWWITPAGNNIGVYRGGITVQQFGGTTTVTGLPSGFKIGDLSGSKVHMQPPSGSKLSVWRSRVHFVLVNRGGMGAGSSIHHLVIELRLAWIAGALGVLAAALMFIRTRTFGPGRCPGCGYDLSGIAPGSPCPECGTASGIHVPQQTT